MATGTATPSCRVIAVHSRASTTDGGSRIPLHGCCIEIVEVFNRQSRRVVTNRT